MLRKIVILAAVTLFAAATASAGLLPSWGLKAGANFSNINLDDLDSSSRTGFVGGAFVNLAWPIFNLQGELLYSTKGFKDAKDTDLTQYDYTVHSVQIPILAKVKIPIPVIAPSAYIGPAVAFTTKAEFQDSAGETFDAKDQTESSVWSLVMGIDLTLFDLLIVDARYDMDLSALSKAAITDYDKEIKGRTITVMVGIAF